MYLRISYFISPFKYAAHAITGNGNGANLLKSIRKKNREITSSDCYFWRVLVIWNFCALVQRGDLAPPEKMHWIQSVKARAKPPAQGRLMWYGMASLQRPQIVAEIPRVQESEKAVIKTRPVTDPLRVPKWSDIKWNHSYQLMQALITVQLAVLKRNPVPRTRIRFHHQGPLPIKIRNSRCLSTIRSVNFPIRYLCGYCISANNFRK